MKIDERVATIHRLAHEIMNDLKDVKTWGRHSKIRTELGTIYISIKIEKK